MQLLCPSHWQGGSLVSQLVKNCSCEQCRSPQCDSWAGKICWRRDRPPTLVFLGFPGGSAGKEPSSNAGDLGLIPGLGRSPGEGNGNPLQYSCLENSMDCLVHGVAKSWTQLSDFHSTTWYLRLFSLIDSGHLGIFTVKKYLRQS